jgi:hypothetical protein
MAPQTKREASTAQGSEPSLWPTDYVDARWKDSISLRIDLYPFGSGPKQTRSSMT